MGESHLPAIVSWRAERSVGKAISRLILSLRAERSNLLACMQIASPPVTGWKASPTVGFVQNVGRAISRTLSLHVCGPPSKTIVVWKMSLLQKLIATKKAPLTQTLKINYNRSNNILDPIRKQKSSDSDCKHPERFSRASLAMANRTYKLERKRATTWPGLLKISGFYPRSGEFGSHRRVALSI